MNKQPPPKPPEPFKAPTSRLKPLPASWSMVADFLALLAIVITLVAIPAGRHGVALVTGFVALVLVMASLTRTSQLAAKETK